MTLRIKTATMFKHYLFYLAFLFSFNCSFAQDKPNIIIIYADDMGYGDINILNKNSKIPTPNLDQLAKEGVSFTNAHSSSGICSPSRYALLTGKYHWRTTHKIVNSFGKPMFKDSDRTIARELKDIGYKTAAIGKWHLGWNWKPKNPPSGKIQKKNKTIKCFLPSDFNWNESISGGPLDRGFDYYFGDGTINFPPYAWVENNKILDAPTELLTENTIGFKVKEGEWEFRAGPKVENWNPYDVLPTLTKKTKNYIKSQQKGDPFFLYFALPCPHAPIIPNDEFDGTSKAGAYGDFVVQTDYIVGEIVKTLKEQGLEENTIVIFSSDNGPEKYAYERILNFNHYSMGEFRGLKRDVYEGGHHVPLIIKWPEKIKTNQTSNQLIGQIDIYNTLVSLTNSNKNFSSLDGIDFSNSILKNNFQEELRPYLIHNTFEHTFAIRKGDFVYINSPKAGTTKIPKEIINLQKLEKFNTPDLLFNIKDDIGQRKNLIDKYPEVRNELKSLLEKELSEKYTLNKK